LHDRAREEIAAADMAVTQLLADHAAALMRCEAAAPLQANNSEAVAQDLAA
jgi:hypothetical protein